MANKPSELSDLTNVMSGCVGSLQHAFDHAFDHIGVSIKQSADMMQQMNEMMEAMLLHNLQIHTTISYSRTYQCTCIHLQIQNTFKLPIQGLTWNLSFRKRHEFIKSDLNLNILKLPEPTEQMPNPAEEIYLSSYGTLDYLFGISCPTLDQYNGTLDFTFPSPGTGKPLHTEVKFGIYYIQQCCFEYIAEPLTVLQRMEQTGMAIAAVDGLRKILQISPLDGMMMKEEGFYQAQLQDVHIIFQLSPIADSQEQDTLVQVDCWISQQDKITASEIIDELQRLTEVKQ